MEDYTLFGINPSGLKTPLRVDSSGNLNVAYGDQTAPVIDLIFTQEKLPPGVTFIRSSKATRINSQGIIEDVEFGIPRFEYSPLTKESLGLLIEQQSTNICPFSGEVPGSVGVQSGFISTAPLPILGAVATRLTGDGTSNPHLVFGGSLPSPLSASSSYTMSVYVRGTGLVQLTTSVNNAAIDCYVNVDLSNGTFLRGAGVIVGSVCVQNCGNNVWRICAGFTSIASPTSSGASVAVGLISNLADSRLPVNTSTASVDVLGFQLEAGVICTSYIRTFGSAVTRASDSCYVSTTGWINTNQGTLITESYRPLQHLTYTYQPATLSDGSLNNRLQLQVGSGTPNTFGVVQRSSGVVHDYAGSTANGGSPGQVIRCGSTYTTLGAIASQNGATAQVSATAVAPLNMTTLYIGANGAGTPQLAYVRKISYYNTALIPATLQNLTSL